MMMDVVREVMFDNAYLDHATGHVTRCNSHAISMQGNRVMISGTVVQKAGTEGDANDDQLVLTLEGSYDGQVWVTTDLGTLSFDLSSVEAPTNSASSTPVNDVDYAFLRLRAELTTTGSLTNDPRVLFDADLVMSHQ